MSNSELVEDIILKIGGCGIFQYMASAIMHAGKILPVWNYHFLTFGGQTPEITCVCEKDTADSRGKLSNTTVQDICFKDNVTIIYDNSMATIVSEWNLICDRKWIPTFIFTILFIGSSLGAVASGPIADRFGRKPVYCTSILLLVLFNGISVLSTSWEMYAVLQFFTGVALEAYLNVGTSLCAEYTPKSSRAVAVLIPSWSVAASLFALVAWWLHDWRKIHLLNAVIGIPFLASWCLFQESIRWMTTKQRTEDAERAICIIAAINRKEKPDLSKLFIAAKSSTSANTSSSFLNLFRDRALRKITVSVWILCFGSYFALYGMAFGVKSIAGDLYTNMFLLNIADLPMSLISPWLVERFGRKRTSAVSFCTSGFFAMAVGLLEHTEICVNHEVIRILALVAKLFTALCCQILTVYALELYPTVIRTTALGFHILAADVATVIVPIVIRMDENVKGILYFLSGSLLIVSAIIVTVFLRETKGLVLEETLRMTACSMNDKKYHSTE